MLEVPSLAFAPNSFKKVDFLMVGGNDLKQFSLLQIAKMKD